MATIRTYTNIEQSRKLAGILPIESADMNYWCGTQIRIGGHRTMDKDLDVPCWSLASLLGVIKDKCGYFEFVYLKRTYDSMANPLEDVYRLSTDVSDVYKKEAVDACVAMIELLHEQNLL